MDGLYETVFVQLQFVAFKCRGIFLDGFARRRVARGTLFAIDYGVLDASDFLCRSREQRASSYSWCLDTRRQSLCSATLRSTRLGRNEAWVRRFLRICCVASQWRLRIRTLSWSALLQRNLLLPALANQVWHSGRLHDCAEWQRANASNRCSREEWCEAVYLSLSVVLNGWETLNWITDNCVKLHCFLFLQCHVV